MYGNKFPKNVHLQLRYYFCRV